MGDDTIQAIAVNIVSCGIYDLCKTQLNCTKDKLKAKFNSPSAFDEWMELTGNNRAELLTNQMIEFGENKKYQLSKLEKLSPISGISKVFDEYMGTPLEEKVEFLRNALTNGIFGDYTIELREDFYRIIENIQPLDIHVLKYLVSQCPSQNFYLEKHRISDETKKTLEEKFKKHELTEAEYKELTSNEITALNKLETSLSFESIKDHFNKEEFVIQRSIDRLLAAGLIYNNGANRFGVYNHYLCFVPLNMAQPFLEFIQDPRN